PGGSASRLRAVPHDGDLPERSQHPPAAPAADRGRPAVARDAGTPPAVWDALADDRLRCRGFARRADRGGRPAGPARERLRDGPRLQRDPEDRLADSPAEAPA